MTSVSINLKSAALFTIFFTSGLEYAHSSDITNAVNKADQQAIYQKSQIMEKKDEITAGMRNGVQSHITTRKRLRDEDFSLPEDNPCWIISNIVLDDKTHLLKLNAINGYLKKITRKCIGVNGVRELSRAINNEFIDLGFITTRVNLPKQNLTSGTLIFDVTPGIVGKVVSTNKSDYITLKTLIPTVSGDILNLRDLERGKENLQRVIGTQSRIFLYPAKEFGKTDIVVQHSQDKYWHVGSWIDNEGNPGISRYQAGSLLYLNNLTSLNDTFYISYAKNLGYNAGNIHKNRNYSFYYSVPLGYWDIEGYYSWANLNQKIDTSFSALNYDTFYQFAYGSLKRLLVHNSELRSSLNMALFYNKSWAELVGVPLKIQDKKSAGWKLSYLNDFTLSKADISTKISYQNKEHWFGGTYVEKNHDISYQGRVFSAEVFGNYPFRIKSEDFIYAVHLSGQASFDRLTTLDQFYLGSQWTVRGFDGRASLSRDNGWFIQNDLKWNVHRFNIQPYVGIDMGQVSGGNSQNIAQRTLAGSAIGVHGNGNGFAYHLYFGHPLTKIEEIKSHSFNSGFSFQWQY
ncbi:ShlB/FhaC/HecB family hemolysin secretion/activation protein [Enterobacter cancerogenus]|uniref:ShlB/FhaC/HecB family hemolysin secretion/activation protein n=1 Tax=Enterobacter cancerogenus TaxID=69218 RepID=UPI0007341CB5|nr:ShlB/FhaC/HecB family hemolysin secretion/activation protein [Enterobacter cancerogenus]KTQ46844.1 hypothetical protein NS104_14210 [Enterobacter cancerogenus]KTQ49130.1 hypothetical protein NS111_18515 [Enterobacter cancerogenus]KTQ69258.1 hypothetical protein NS188_20345 [Enterobacter cancerogenus]KTQ80347.1 hypothetical protein NS31R_12870 [Enterobacter cancerogenus]